MEQGVTRLNQFPRFEHGDKGHDEYRFTSDFIEGNHQQPDQGVNREDVARVKNQVKKTKAEEQAHPPHKTAGEIDSFFSVVFELDVKTESEKQRENGVSFSGEKKADGVVNPLIPGLEERMIGNDLIADFEMFQRMNQNDTQEGESPQGIDQSDSGGVLSQRFRSFS